MIGPARIAQQLQTLVQQPPIGLIQKTNEKTRNMYKEAGTLYSSFEPLFSLPNTYFPSLLISSIGVTGVCEKNNRRNI